MKKIIYIKIMNFQKILLSDEPKENYLTCDLSLIQDDDYNLFLDYPECFNYHNFLGDVCYPVKKIDWEVSRILAYSQLNQFDLISSDLINGTTNYISIINDIKNKYPKNIN